MFVVVLSLCARCLASALTTGERAQKLCSATLKRVEIGISKQKELRIALFEIFALFIK